MRPLRLRLSSDLDCAPAEAYRWVKTPRLLSHVAGPLLVFEPLEPAHFPEEWAPGDYRVRMRFLGLLPLGLQTVGIRVPGAQRDGRYEIVDDGRGQLIRRWHHRILIEPAPGGKTRYTDELELEAGLLTRVAWLFAWAFYRYRQHRWRGLARHRFGPLQTQRP